MNRDDIRFQLYGKYWGEGVDESVVSKVEEAMVEAAIQAGKSVVIDATHLAARFITRWRKLYGNVEIIDFVVPVQVLIDRDAERLEAGERGVTAQVIHDMARRFHIKPDGTLPPLPDMPSDASAWTPAPKYNGSAPEAIIVDIDGTIANHTGVRSPYDTSRYHLDGVHYDVVELVQALCNYGYTVLFVSGRDEEFRLVTQNWIERETGLIADKLFMRPQGDRRNDAIVKHELFHEHIADKYNVIGVFDDRPRVLRMWHAIGLTTFRCGDPCGADF